MTILDNFNIYIQVSIVASIIVAFVFLTNLVMYSTRIRVTQRTIRYVYSFSSGFLLITAIVGQFVSAQTALTVHWRTVNISNGLDLNNPSFLQSLISIFVILFGFVIGISISIIAKKLMHRNHDEEKEHNHHDDHGQHSPLIETRYEHNVKKSGDNSKLDTAMMILSHRIPEGIAMGALVYLSSILSHEGVRTYGLAMSSLVAFAIHLIPESLLVFYTRVHAGESRLKAGIITSGSLLVFFPLMYIGLTIGHVANTYDAMFWIQPLIFVIVASLLIWEVITELIPEFIHIKNNSTEVLWMLITFMVGIASSGIVQMLHFH